MRRHDVNAVGIIPARGGSTRVPRKNVAVLCGKPLVAWAIDAALGSAFVGPDRVYVSTDDEEIAGVAIAFGARVIHRPPALGADDAWTEPVIQHAVLEVERAGTPVELIAWLNPCVPQLQSADIDRAISMLLDDDLREVVSVGQTGRSNSAVRALKRETLFQRRLSVHFGVLSLPYVDINTQDDFLRAAELLAKGTRSAG